MDVEQLKKDVQSGTISVGRLIELIVALQRELQAAKRRIEQLQRQVGVPPSSKISQPFSVEAEERRQEARERSGGSESGGHRPGGPPARRRSPKPCVPRKSFPRAC